MPRSEDSHYRDLVVLAIVPAVVAMLTLASWVLARREIGPDVVNAALAVAAVLFGGLPRFIAGFKDAFQRKITVNVFVVVALVATMAIGEFRPAAVIVFIMAVAGALESYTLDKTRRSIRDLLDFAPRLATVRRQGGETTVPVAELQAGDTVVVKPGARIPVDGLVTAGASSVNQAPITGESLPVEKFPGSSVFSGTLNESGRLEIRTAKVGENTTLAKIVHLVQEAQGTRAPVQNMADRFTTWFLPTVVALALIAFAISGAVKVAVSVLLVACPCAFAIATPTAAIADEIRPEIPETIRMLKTMGVERITMLTGDHPRVAEAVAKTIGVDGFQAGLLPEHKQESVRTLQADGHVVGMIGDGINDAPALALADVGIAMGAGGTDVAIETADVTLMHDDLAGVADFIWMSAKVLRRIKLNIFFSMIYNVIGLTLSVVGWMTPIIAVIFQEAGCITVVFSSTLLLWSRRSTATVQGRLPGARFKPTGAIDPAVIGH